MMCLILFIISTYCANDFLSINLQQNRVIPRDVYIMMKHLLFSILFSALLLAFAGCNKDFEVTSLVLYPSSVETTPLDTIQISFAMEYSGGDFKDPNLISPVWESSNPDVVEVDDMGKIYTITPGNADVTMSCGGASAICKVTVISYNESR